MTQSASPALQSAAAAGVDRENPWPGLAAFTEEISEFFFGREAETQELFRLVKRETLTILFGQSGLGKSSLLQAGLSPKLRAADLLPVYLRLDHAVGGAPLAEQVKAAIAKKIAAREIDGTAPGGEGQTLWEYFHHKDAEFWTPKNQLATPVLIFDQFEELFTLGRSSDTARARGEAFIEQLADLIENRMPAGLRQRINDGGASSEAYVYDDPGCKILLSLREDYLPDLEGLRARIRSIMQNRMRIRRMNGAQALDVVEKAGGDLVEKGVAPWIVHFVSTAGAQSETAAPSDHLEELEVEPALLSIFCRELNNKRKRQGQAQITAGLLKESRKGILSDFYQHSVEDLPEQVRVFVEDKLLTASGFRDNYALENALLEPGVTREVLERLVTRRLLRVDDRQGVQRVELTHDVLAAPIRASRDERQHRLALARAAEREHEARRKLGQARQRIALYIALAGLAVSAPLLWYSFHQKAEAMQQRGAAMAEKENADKARRAAERSARDTTEALGVANKALRDYYALKVQLALQQTPPEAMVAEMLLRHAVAGNTFEHGDVVDTLIPAAPFAAEKSVKLDRPVSRLLYSPDAALMVAVGPGAPPAAPAGPGAGAGGSGLTLIDGATGAATPWKMPEDLAKATISDVCFEPAAAAGGTGRLAVRMLDPDAGDIIVRWDCGKRQEVLPRLRLTKWPVAAPERGNDPGTGGSADAGKPAGARPPGTPAAAPAPPAPGKESKALVIAMPMAFHPEGTKLAAAGPEGLIGIFDLAAIPAQDKYADLAPTDTTRTPEATATGDFSLPTAGMGVRTPPPASKAPVQAIAYSQQGSVLLAQTAAATFSWLSDEVNLAGAHVVERLDTNLVPTGLAVSPPGARFCTLLKNQSLNSGGKVTLWHYYAGSTNPTHEEYDIDRTTINESATINAAAYSMDGQWLATGTDHGVRVYWSHANMPMQALPQNGRATAIAFRPDGMGLVTAAESPKGEGEGTTLQFWRTSARAAAPARGLGEEETLQAVTPGGKSILVLNHRVLRVFEVNSGKLQAEYQFPGSGGFSDMVLRDDLHPIVAINDGKGLVVTDAAEGRGLVRIPPMETINFMRLSPDGRYFVVSGEDERARLYDLTGAAPMREFDLAEPGAATRRAAAAGPGDDLFDLGDYHFVDQYAAFSHDGKKLAVFSFDGQVVRQYALADGKFLSKFSVNEDIASLAYSGDDTMFLYGVDRHLVCFDPALGRPIIDVRRPEYFSRISISADNRVCVVDAAPAAGLFLRPQAPASMEDLHAAARRTLDEHQNAVPFTPAQSGITPPEPVVARFWSAWLETQRRVQLTSHDGGNVLSAAAVARAYEPLRTLFEQNPDAAYPAAAQAAREALRFLTPLTGAPPAAELTRRAAFIEGRAPVERIVLLRDLLAHLEARDPHRAALSAALAGAYSERIEDVEWHDDTERDIEIGAAFEALQQAIAAGYSDWRLINDTVSSRALKSDIRYCVLFERMIRDLPADAPGRADGIAQAATAWTRRVTNNRWPEFDTPERREAVDKAFALMRQAIDLGYRDWHEVHWQFDAYDYDHDFDYDARMPALLQAILDKLPPEDKDRARLTAHVAAAHARRVGGVRWTPAQAAEKDAETRQAIDLLKKAIALGFKDWDDIDRDFSDSLQADPAFPLAVVPDKDLTSLAARLLNARTRDGTEQVLRITDAAFARGMATFHMWYYKGSALSRLERFAEAVQCFHQALPSAPDDSWKSATYRELAGAERRLGADSLPEALDDATHAVDLSDRDGRPPALGTRARILFQLGRDDAAAADLNRIVSEQPEEVVSYDWKGTVLLQYPRERFMGQAIDAYTRALALTTDPADQFDYREQRALAYRYAGRYDEALEDLKILRRSQPGDFNIISDYATVQAGLGHPREAIADYTAAIGHWPEEAWLYARRGLARLETGDTAGAKEDFTAAMRFDDSDDATIISDYMDAICDPPLSLAAEAEARLVRLPVASDALARLKLKQGKKDEAAPLLAQLIARNPDHVIFRAYAGQFEPAINDALRLYKSDPATSNRAYSCAVALLARAASADAPEEQKSSDRVRALFYIGRWTAGVNNDAYELQHRWDFRLLAGDSLFAQLVAAQKQPGDHWNRAFERARFFAQAYARLKDIARDEAALCYDAVFTELETARRLGIPAATISEHPDFAEFKTAQRFSELLKTLPPG